MYMTIGVNLMGVEALEGSGLPRFWDEDRGAGSWGFHEILSYPIMMYRNMKCEHFIVTLHR